MRAWVTGAAGSIGSALMQRLNDAVGTDLDVDVTDARAVFSAARQIQPDIIFHCAAEKHAPGGELDPVLSAAVNIDGTRNLLDTGIRVILASTCKAADPETVYGAVKLVAERMVLNRAGSVARFYNVIESSGNVFEIWKKTTGPLPVAPCWRYFIHIDQAVDLLLESAFLPSGRYTVDPGAPRFMPDVARELYPGRDQVEIPPRRGDRTREPLHAQSEYLQPISGAIRRVVSIHDVERENTWQTCPTPTHVATTN